MDCFSIVSLVEASTGRPERSEYFVLVLPQRNSVNHFFTMEIDGAQSLVFCKARQNGIEFNGNINIAYMRGEKCEIDTINEFWLLDSFLKVS